MRITSFILHLTLIFHVRSEIIQITTNNPIMTRLMKAYPIVRKASKVSRLKADGDDLSTGTKKRLEGPKAPRLVDSTPNAPRLVDSTPNAPRLVDSTPNAPSSLRKDVLNSAHKSRNPIKSFGKGISKVFRAMFKREIKETRFTGNDANHLFSYLGEFSIGSPAQNLRLLMDTGSSRLWVRGEGQCNIGAQRCETYNPTKSRTFSDLDEPAKKITYGDGSYVEGKWIRDSVQIGAFSAENFKLQLGTNVNDAADEDGIVGFGFSVTRGVPTLWESLLMKQIPDSPVFSTYIDETETTGAFIMGGVDLARYKGDIIWSSVADKSGVYWGLEVFKLALGSTVFSATRLSGIHAVIDTGTSLAIFPRHIADGLNRGLKLPRIDIGGPSDKYYGFPCPNGNVPFKSRLPWLTITIENQILTFSPKDYLFVYPDNKGQLMCVSGIVGSDMNHIIVGNLLLRKYYLVFDQWFQKIGFATPNRSRVVRNQFEPTSFYRWKPGRG